MRGRWEVNNKQWAALEPILSSPRRSHSAIETTARVPDDTRSVLNAVLWVLATGAEWRDLPSKYPPHQTCHRRLQRWVKTGQLEHALRALAGHLQEQGKLCVEEVFPERISQEGSQRETWEFTVRGERTRRHPSPLLTVFLSPLGSRALARADLN